MDAILNEERKEQERTREQTLFYRDKLINTKNKIETSKKELETLEKEVQTANLEIIKLETEIKMNGIEIQMKSDCVQEKLRTITMYEEQLAACKNLLENQLTDNINNFKKVLTETEITAENNLQYNNELDKKSTLNIASLEGEIAALRLIKNHQTETIKEINRIVKQINLVMSNE